MKWLKYNENINFKNTAITIGKFDAIHLGHQLLIEKLKQKEDTYTKIMLNFDFHDKMHIFTREEKEHILDSMDIDYVIEFDFDKVGNISATDFIEKILIDKLDIKYMVCGDDFKFGKNREGNVNLLKNYTDIFETLSLQRICYMGDYISSSRIIEKIELGNMESVNAMLGFPFFLRGEVVKGNQIGRTMGVPTANVNWPDHKIMPPNGVYASKVKIDGEEFFGVSNIGIKPTIAYGYSPLIEVNIFDFDRDIYGKLIDIEIYMWTRKEQKFESLSLLGDRLVKDIQNAKKYFDC